MAELPRVGFVGLGIMGRPMAHNLLRAGYPLVVWNRSPGPVAELQAAGAEAAATPAALAARCDVVITVLLNTEVVEQVVLGPEGLAAKACNQLVVGITIDAVAEALLLARAAGVDPARVREALLGGFAQSRVLDLHGARMLEGRFAPGFRAPLQVKDLAIAAELGAATSQPLPGTETALGLYRAMVAAGLGDLDHSGLYVLLEEQGRS